MQIEPKTIEEIVKMANDAQKEIEVCDHLIEFYTNKKKNIIKDLEDFNNTVVSSK